ncbi:MAG: hypothetical protein WAS33_10395 [Candidatus Promineifilaceae bacterium]
MSSSQVEYEEYLILSAIAEGYSELIKIAHACGGMYPTELLNKLQVLESKKLISKQENGHYFIEKNYRVQLEELDVSHFSSLLSNLPLPHPHDYDWRFTQETARNLAESLFNRNTLNEPVILLGAPSVFLNYLKIDNTNHVILLDQNQELLEYLSAASLPHNAELKYHTILSSEVWIPNVSVGMVFCDPPWYPEHYNAFMIQAASITKIGSQIILAFPPINTRPGICVDRWSILKTANELGLHIEEITPHVLTYETPTFETVSLKHEGLDTSFNWRPGDLVHFRKINNIKIQTVDDRLTSQSDFESEGTWDAILIGRYKIKIRRFSNKANEFPELISIESDDILPTVSRRYEGRGKIDLWLWDNRVFALKNSEAFWAALHIIANKSMPQELSTINQEFVETALHLLKKIIT